MNLLGKKKMDYWKMAYTITPAGKDRLENQQGTGLQLRVLTSLLERGPMTVNEIDHDTNTKDAHKIYVLVMDGMRLGFISPIKGTDM